MLKERSELYKSCVKEEVVNRLERILMMAYAVQNYKDYFGLYPSSGIYKTKDHKRFGDWISFHPQMDGAG
jgi:hypothetical protein